MHAETQTDKQHLQVVDRTYRWMDGWQDGQTPAGKRQAHMVTTYSCTIVRVHEGTPQTHKHAAYPATECQKVTHYESVT